TPPQPPPPPPPPPPAPPPPAPPSCDAYADTAAECGLTEIGTTGGTRSGTNVGATGEAGEPNHAGDSVPLDSVWYHFTPAATRTFIFDTCTGTGFDTTLAVYTGTSVNALTPVAGGSNDDACGVQSRVAFIGSAGVTYHIAIDG